MNIDNPDRENLRQVYESLAESVQRRNFSEWEESWGEAKADPVLRSESAELLSSVRDKKFASRVFDSLSREFDDSEGEEQTGVTEAMANLGVCCDKYYGKTTDFLVDVLKQGKAAVGPTVEALKKKSSQASIRKDRRRGGEILGQFLSLAQSESSKEDRMAGLKGVKYCLWSSTHKETTRQTLNNLLTDADPEIREEALDTIFHSLRFNIIEENDPIVETIKKMMLEKAEKVDSMVPEVKIRFAQQLIQLGIEFSKPILEKLLKDPDEWVRMEARASFRALGVELGEEN